jgi:NTP pyrophosphatase (non-canonical NTP hydrolase)
VARRRIYIAGPISQGDLASNMNQAVQAYTRLIHAGFAPLCPHLSCYAKPVHSTESGAVWCEATTSGKSGIAHDAWLAVDLQWVAVSEAVLRLPGESPGADRETAFAQQLGIPVFPSVEHVINSPVQRGDRFDMPSFSRVNLERCTSPTGFNHAGGWTLSDWMVALLGEIGEAANVLKKLNRFSLGINGNDQEKAELETQFSSELADAFIYLDLLVQHAGINLPEAVRSVWNAKSRKIGYPVQID